MGVLAFVAGGVLLPTPEEVTPNNPAPQWIGLFFGFLVGAAITPILPAAFAFGTEVTYPLQPALVTGLLMSGA